MKKFDEQMHAANIERLGVEGPLRAFARNEELARLMADLIEAEKRAGVLRGMVKRVAASKSTAELFTWYAGWCAAKAHE